MLNKPFHKLRKTEGQILVWFALSLGVIILFAALAVDMGMIYLTKARLGNSVDSAVLTAAKNYGQGVTTAQNLGTDMFQANYGSNSPTLTWTWCTGTPACNGVISAQLHASTSYHTSFMQYLPNLAFWTLGDTAVAQRSTLVMMIVLDRSGSMSSDGGGAALQSAVPTFVSDFTNGSDYIGMVSFASHSSIDVPITQQFKSPIDSAVSSMSFVGGTFGTGAGSGSIYSATNGPPMSMADTQLGTITLPNGAPEVKVMVYFTDGLMNTLQDQFNCGSAVPTLLNYGGFDVTSCGGTQSNNPAYGVPTLDYTSENGGGIWGQCYDQTQYSGDGCGCQTKALVGSSSGGLCQNTNGYVTTFPSQKYGGQRAISRPNVTEEAQYRAIYTANQMRQETIPTYVYTIGLGNDVAGDACVEAFLSSVANDPGGSQYSCPSAPAQYSSSLPEGEFFPVGSCPGASCTADLNAAFQTIASKVALRLTQ